MKENYDQELVQSKPKPHSKNYSGKQTKIYD